MSLKGAIEDFSLTEENYLKAIFHLAQKEGGNVSTNALAYELGTKAASVSEMLKKLAAKDAIHYLKYKGVSLTDKGKHTALWIIRKHRLWEVFLVEKLKFNWDEVHQVAEQLEHIRSQMLIERLDDYLGNPKYDPHGDPIPDRDGNLQPDLSRPLSDEAIGASLRVVGVQDSSKEFLHFLDKMGVALRSQLTIRERFEYDGSIEVEFKKSGKRRVLSKVVADNLMVEPIS